MRSPQSLRNGETPRTPNHNHPLHHPHFHSTVSIQKLRRINALILVLRFATFCFTLASTIFMATNTRRGGSNSPSWHEFDSFRFVLAANAIVALYSFAEMGFSVWEILKGTTLLPETFQVWFDFGHDQVFAYMLLAADASGTNLARTMTGQDICTTSNAFCIQSAISIALGFAGFLFLGCSTLLSGFRVVCFIINGSRFHV